MKIPFEPNLRTSPQDLCKEELNKLHSKNAFEGNLYEEFRNEKPDLSWEAEQIAKSHGIYLAFDRAHKGPDKHWFYMVRISLPGGGPLSAEQWLALDRLSDQYTRDPEGRPSLRLTTRQAIQFHWVPKKGILELIGALAKLKLKTLNGCGDNARNVLACPLSSAGEAFDANRWAAKVSQYFQLPPDPYIRIFDVDPALFPERKSSFTYGPQLLNRKLKIAFASLRRDPETGIPVPDNCTEFLTGDIGIAPLLGKNGSLKFQIYLGGGQGEKNAKPGAAMLAQPFGIVGEERLLATLDAVAAVHQKWGDRQNRFWARLKYVVKKMGMPWYLAQVRERIDFEIDPPDPAHDYGSCTHHLGWTALPGGNFLAFGLFVENGRIKDGTANGDVKTLVRRIVEKYKIPVAVTPHQHLIFLNIPAARREEFDNDLSQWGFDRRNGKPFSKLRLSSSACVGLDTCRLAYTESEKFEPLLIDELEKMGWGDMTATIGLTGCERQCDRPATKAVGLIGSGLNRYQLKLMGTEDGRHQGKPVISPASQRMYLRSVPREKLAVLLDTLFRFYVANKTEGESLGYFHRRVGFQSLIDHLSRNPATADLMAQTFDTDSVLEI